MSKFSAIILAAGKGTRMKSQLPKVLHEIACRPMVNYVIDTISQLKPANIIAVTSTDSEPIKKVITAENTKVSFAVQKEQLGTGHAVKSAFPKLGKTSTHTIILYGDTPFISADTIRKILSVLDSKQKPAVVVLGFSPEDPAEYGRLVINRKGELDAIVEYKDASHEQRKIGFCNSGVIAVRSGLLNELISNISNKNAKKEYYLTDIVGIARQKGYRCSAIETSEDEVMGINSREQLAFAESVIQDKFRKAAMDSGVTLIDPYTVYFSYDTRIGSDVVIQPNVVIGKNTIINDRVEIKSFSHIEGAIIEEGAKIGPFARLRPGSEIGQNVKIGNFVEIKKSKIGSGSAISHLTYIGDTAMGKNVNIGAGTITCNYDGKSKHNTIIEDNVFVGSNSSLIAPLKIGEGAVIGAGATVIKDVKKKSKVVTDAKQREIK